MSELDATLEQARAIIGKQVGISGTREVERGAIQRFVEAVNDQNPLWSDREYAATTRFGDVIAPLTFVSQLVRAPVDVTKDRRPSPPLPIPSAKAVNGGNEYEFREPIRPGDRITMESRIADVRKKEGKSGDLVLVVTETTYTNQHNRIVAVSRLTMIYR